MSTTTPTSRSESVSVVFSFRNEAENLPVLIGRLEKVFAGAGTEYELVFVNDASTDGSLPILLEERKRNSRIKILNMSRRFGVGECVMAGLAAASGDAVIYMDTDLQDPPEIIPSLIECWRKGAAVVHTVRTHRHGESALKMLATKIAYRIIRFNSTIVLPVDAGDFKLLSREAVVHMLSLRESDPYLRGLTVWLGFNQAFVPYERDARHAGRTHFPFFSKGPWTAFITGMTSFSFLPIYAVLALAVAGLGFSLLLVACALALWAASSAMAGPTALFGVVAFFWASTIASIAAVGLYIIRIYKDVRGRPLSIVQSTVGK